MSFCAKFKNVQVFVTALYLLYNTSVPVMADDGGNSGLENNCAAYNVSESDLFEFLERRHPYYSEGDRPRLNGSETVRVALAYRLYGIKDFMEMLGTLVLEGYLSVSWHDDFNRWEDDFPYSCISCVLAWQRKAWRPDITILTDTLGEFRDQILYTSKVLIYKSGDAGFYPLGRSGTRCHLDLSYFPFDTQKCTIHIESWNLHESQQKLVLAESEPFVKVSNFWYENQQWEVIGNSSKEISAKHDDGAVYSTLVFTLLLKRKPYFYYTTVIIPSIVIAVVEIVVFLLPNAEVNKLAVSITSLVAYSVFQGMIIGDMPRSGSTMPLLSLYIDLQMSYIGWAIIGSGIVFYINHQGHTKAPKPPPRWLFKTAKILGYVLHPFSVPAESDHADVHSASALDGPTQDINQRANATLTDKWAHFADFVDPFSSLNHMDVNFVVPLEPLNVATHDDSAPMANGSATEQWTYIADVVNRITSLTYTGAMTLTPIGLFLLMPQTPVTLEEDDTSEHH